MSRLIRFASIGFVAVLLCCLGFVIQHAPAQRPTPIDERPTGGAIIWNIEEATGSAEVGLPASSQSENDGIVRDRPTTFFRDGKLFVRIERADAQQVLEIVKSVYRDFEDLNVTVESESNDIRIDAPLSVAEQVANLINTLDAAAIDAKGNSKTVRVVELGPEFDEQQSDKDRKRYIFEVYELKHANPFEVRDTLLKQFPKGIETHVRDGKLLLSFSEPTPQKLAVKPLIESLEKAAEQRDLAEKQMYAADQLRFEQEVTSLKKNIERLQAQYERMKTESGEENPGAQAVNAAVQLLQQKINQATQQRERAMAAAAAERQKLEASRREAGRFDGTSRGRFSGRSSQTESARESSADVDENRTSGFSSRQGGIRSSRRTASQRQEDDTDLEEAEPNQGRQLSELNRLSQLMTEVESKLLETKLSRLDLLRHLGANHPEVRIHDEITALLQKELNELEGKRAKLHEAESSLGRAEAAADAALADRDLPVESKAAANSVLNDASKSFKDRLSRLRSAIENLKAAGLESEAKELAIKAEQLAAQEAERLAKQKLANAQARERAMKRQQVEVDRQRDNASRQTGSEVLQIVRELREEVRALRRDVNQIQELLKKSQQQAGGSFGFDEADDSSPNSERVLFGVGVDSDAGVSGSILLDESQFDWSRDDEVNSDDAAAGATEGFIDLNPDGGGATDGSLGRVNVNDIRESGANANEDVDGLPPSSISLRRNDDANSRDEKWSAGIDIRW